METGAPHRIMDGHERTCRRQLPSMGTESTISLPGWPWRLVGRLAATRNSCVWLVGGAVRDLLLNRPIRDWDFAVDRDALGLARAAADALGGAYFALDAARDTGRALVRNPSGARVALDFAALRGHDLAADLADRDFTVNALALDRAGSLLDPTGGLPDLHRGRIRMTSPTVFRRDPLRLLRAVRIAAELAFAIEPETLSAMRREASLLARVSPERRRDELMRLLTLSRAGGALQEAHCLRLLDGLVPELTGLAKLTQSPPHRFDVWTHTLVVVDTTQNMIETVRGSARTATLADVPDTAWNGLARILRPYAGHVEDLLALDAGGSYDRAQLLKLAALLHDVGKVATGVQDDVAQIHFYGHESSGSRTAEQRLRQLRFPGEVVDRIVQMVCAHLRPGDLARSQGPTRRAVYRYFRALGDTGVDVVLLSLCDYLGTWGPNLQPARWVRRLAVAEGLLGAYFVHFDERVAPAPLITGRDLLRELGFRPGPALGRVLEQVLEAQAAGEVGTRDEALALAARIARSLDRKPDVG